MELENIDTLLEKHGAQSKHSDADIKDAEIVLVSDSLSYETYLDVVYSYDFDPVHNMPLRLQDEYKDKNIFQQIDSAINRSDIKKVFAYIPRRSFDNVASCYADNSIHSIFSMTSKK